jgi:hypothetical protein
MASKKKVVPRRKPSEGAKGKKKESGIRVWAWYYPNQLDQIGRPGPFGGVYKIKPEPNEYSRGATLMSGLMREVVKRRGK